MNKEIEEMLQKNLISIVKPDAAKVVKLISQLDIKYYTREQQTPDIWAGWLRMYRRN